MLWVQTSDKAKESKVQVNTCSNTVKKTLTKIANSISIPFQNIAILLYFIQKLFLIEFTFLNACNNYIYGTFTTPRATF